MRLVYVLLLAVLTSACSKQDSTSGSVLVAATSTPPAKVAVSNSPTVQKEPSTLETAVDGFTGRAAVNSGRKAQDKIRGVVRNRDADLNEVDMTGH